MDLSIRSLLCGIFYKRKACTDAHTFLLEVLAPRTFEFLIDLESRGVGKFAFLLQVVVSSIILR